MYLKKVPAFFFQTSGGVEPVRDWLLQLDDSDRRVVGYDIATVEFGWPIGMPVCRSLGGGLWEIRSSLPSRREARILFSVEGERMVLLHALIKKTPALPKRDLDLARRRKSEIAA